MTILSRPQRSLLLFGVVLVVGAILAIFKSPEKAKGPHLPVLPAPTITSSTVDRVPDVSTLFVAWPKAVSSTALIVRVIDGDTVDILPDGETKIVRVRLLGINTPESVDPRRPVQCFGKEASAVAKTLLEGKRIAAVEDTLADDRDKYGRLLRILVMADGTDVNATLVARGYAQAYVDFPMKKERKTQLRRLEAQAREAERGLWNPATCNGKAY